MARAAELGFAIARPWGDSLPFDVALVVTERESRGDSRHGSFAESRSDGRPRPSSRATLDADLSKPNPRPALLRIQIKSTRCRHSDGAYKCHIDSNGVAYREGMIDFIAAYVIPEKVWYILPFEATRRTTGVPGTRGFRVLGWRTEVLLAPNRPHSKYAQYKEAWHLLRLAP